MKKYLLLTTLSLAFLSMPQTLWAGQQYDIDGEELQYEAEEILKKTPAAREVTVRVEIDPAEIATEHVVDFDSFDTNNDGVLSRDEVGEQLFKAFDLDGNEVIDNIEMKTPSVLALVPMERKKIEIIDYGNTGKTEQRSVTVEDFLEETKLSAFDKNKDGLTPLDFLEMPFNRVNVIDDAVINMYEWKRAYAETVRPRHMEPYNYNG